MYAIVRAGSKQQKVAVGDVIEIDKTDVAVGETLTLPVVMTVQELIFSPAGERHFSHRPAMTVRSPAQTMANGCLSPLRHS